MIDKFQRFKEKMLRKYDQLPKMDGKKCEEACQSGKCKFKCCTVSGCSKKEAVLINKFIKKNNLDLPVVDFQFWSSQSYLLPTLNNGASDKLDAKGILDFVKGERKAPICAYLGKEGCLIYEVRPAICRLMGSIKQMPCEHFPEEANADYPPEQLLNIF